MPGPRLEAGIAGFLAELLHGRALVFGFGIVASWTPNPTQAWVRSLVTHAVFGLSLYVGALIFNPALGLLS